MMRCDDVVRYYDVSRDFAKKNDAIWWLSIVNDEDEWLLIMMMWYDDDIEWLSIINDEDEWLLIVMTTTKSDSRL